MNSGSSDSRIQRRLLIAGPHSSTRSFRNGTRMKSLIAQQSFRPCARSWTTSLNVWQPSERSWPPSCRQRRCLRPDQQPLDVRYALTGSAVWSLVQSRTSLPAPARPSPGPRRTRYTQAIDPPGAVHAETAVIYPASRRPAAVTIPPPPRERIRRSCRRPSPCPLPEREGNKAPCPAPETARVNPRASCRRGRRCWRRSSARPSRSSRCSRRT